MNTEQTEQVSVRLLASGLNKCYDVTPVITGDVA